MWSNGRQTAGLLTTLVLVLCTGCLNTVFVASRDAYVGTKVTNQGAPFEVKISNNFGLFGTHPSVRVIEVDREVSRALNRPVKHITGLELTQHVTVWNWVLQSVTLGLYNPRVLVIAGEAHEGEAPPPASVPRPSPAPVPGGVLPPQPGERLPPQ